VLGLEIDPGVDVPRLELAQKFPARRLQDLVGQERIPGHAQAEGEVLGQGQRLRELAPHHGERAGHRGARLPDFGDRMRRLELHPIGAPARQVQIQSLQELAQAAVHGVASVALGHDHEARIQLIACAHGRLIPLHGCVTRDHLDAGRLRAALALDRLVVDPNSGQSGADALVDESAHRGRSTVTGVTVEDHGKRNRAGDIAAELDALGGGEQAGVGECGVVAPGDPGADERRFAAGRLHDLRVKGVGGAQHRQHPIVSRQERAQSSRGSRGGAIRHESEWGRPAPA